MKLFTAPPLSQLGKPKSDAPTPGQPAARRQPVPEAPARVRIRQIARMAQGGRWRVEAMRALSEPCLLWFTRGQGRITLGGVTRGYGPHNAVFIPPGVMHGFEVGPQTQGQAIFFGRANGADLPHATHHLRVREAVAQNELSTVIEAIGREIDSDRPAADRALAHQMGLLSVWLERQIASNEVEAIKTSAARRLVSRYAALLEREFHTGHTVSALAEELGVTVTHLTRACRESCGKSASELLQERRLYEARRMLRDTSTPVKDISESLGYTSPAYFSRAFHARTGKTPSDFRRRG